jgi:hypothetical protein
MIEKIEDKEFTKQELETAENLLIELLVAACKAGDHIRSSITELAIGVAEILPVEAVERSQEYALFRAKKGN